MAKFIAIKSSASGLAGGDYLFNVDQIITVEAVNGTTTTILLTSSQAAEDVATITHADVGTTPSVRDAINAALTANPGGVKARVQLPAGITVSGIAIA
jgi:hypothetical protein